MPTPHTPPVKPTPRPPLPFPQQIPPQPPGRPPKDKPGRIHAPVQLGESGGPKGPEPTRYGDWEQNGRCSDF